MMSPLVSTETPVGRWSCPGERPRTPKRSRNCPSLLNTWEGSTVGNQGQHPHILKRSQNCPSLENNCGGQEGAGGLIGVLGDFRDPGWEPYLHTLVTAGGIPGGSVGVPGVHTCMHWLLLSGSVGVSKSQWGSWGNLKVPRVSIPARTGCCCRLRQCGRRWMWRSLADW